MRRLRQVFLGLLALGLAVLALANRSLVDLFLWPEALGDWIGPPPQLRLPLFMVLLFGVLLGAIIGMLLEWRRERQLRLRVSRQGKLGAAGRQWEAEVEALSRPAEKARPEKGPAL